MPVIKSRMSKDNPGNEFSSQYYSSNAEGQNDITVEEFRANVEMMNRLMSESVKDFEKGAKNKDKKNPPSDTFIDGNFLSVVFAVVFVMIICVSIYAFYNLFLAVLKKFPQKKNSEL